MVKKEQILGTRKILVKNKQILVKKTIMRLIKIRFLFKNLNWKLLLWNCIARLSLCKFNQCFKWLQFLQTEIQNGRNGHRRWSWHMLTPIDSDACCSLTTNHSHLSLDFDATAAEQEQNLCRRPEKKRKSGWCS